MKALIFGPSGSGKTYVSKSLRNVGINAFDGDDMEGLSAWYNKAGHKVPAPKTAGEALNNHYSFLWSKKFLAQFLNKFSDVYIFGGAGNLFDVFDLFDKIYFLKVDAPLQKERILNTSREKPLMDVNDNGIVIWGDWLEQEANKRNVPIIDAALTPEEIFTIISKR